MGKKQTIGTVNRFFIALKSVGVADSRKREIAAIGFTGAKVHSEPDSPLALIVAVLEECKPFWGYSSAEAAEKDVKRLRDFCESLEIEDNRKDGAKP
jgi:hypothetical protein